jgi:hypothetical protein
LGCFVVFIVTSDVHSVLRKNCSCAMESYQNLLCVCVCVYVCMILGFARDASLPPVGLVLWPSIIFKEYKKGNISWNCKRGSIYESTKIAFI